MEQWRYTIPFLSEGNNQVARLMPNSININSKKVRLGIGQSLADTVLTLGNTINQLGFNDGDNLTVVHQMPLVILLVVLVLEQVVWVLSMLV